MRTIENAYGGKKIVSASTRFSDVFNPATGEATARLPLSTIEEISAAVAAAKTASVGWGATPP